MEPWAQSSEARLVEYVDALATVLGREDRAGPLKDYCIGLLMPGERKSVEPMAAIVAPARVSANERRFPPQAPGGAKCLAYPRVPHPEAPPIRPERHIENSIATIRRQLTVALARTHMRCRAAKPCHHDRPLGDRRDTASHSVTQKN